MCMVLGASEAWFFFFFNAFSPPPLHPLPPASPSCPSPRSPLSYWEVFHEQLGPERGEVSERGALCIIQWLSGVCMCACVYICACVALPLLLAGVRWRAGHVAGCQLAFYWSSHTVHNITISWWASLGTSRALSCSSEITQETRTTSAPKQLNHNNNLLCYDFGLVRFFTQFWASIQSKSAFSTVGQINY